MQRDMMPMAIPSGPKDVFPWFLARITPFRDAGAAGEVFQPSLATEAP